MKLHHRLVLFPLLMVAPLSLVACGSSGSNTPQQQPTGSTMAPHTTDTMAPHTTDAMMPHTTDAMTATTGG
jgi:outer membrane biogenesis lipoprotein LolB